MYCMVRLLNIVLLLGIVSCSAGGEEERERAARQAAEERKREIADKIKVYMSEIQSTMPSCLKSKK